MENLVNAKNQFNNPRLKRIINTYQLHYKDGGIPPGFGDYLKTCFFLLQLCKALNLEFDMNFTPLDIENALYSRFGLM